MPNSAKGNPTLAEASLLLAVFFVGTDVPGRWQGSRYSAECVEEQLSELRV